MVASKLSQAFSHFKPFSVLVIGDFLLDIYTIGRVKRISPEAPVPVMEVLKQDSRAGGAGNVVLNLATLGGHVVAMGRVGDDHEGVALRQLLQVSDTSSLFVEPNYKTPVKNRLVADSQQMMRVDFEKLTPVCSEIEEKAIEQLKELIPNVQIVAISDYGKGFLTNKLIQAALEIAREAKVPTIVDPKGADFAKYKGATVLKPNLLEAYSAAKCPLHCGLDEVAHQLKSLTDILMITRSEAGISIFDQDGQRADFPVRSKEVKDVTGAGDTVLSMICLALANGLDIYLATQLANIAAGLSIERIGCVQITLSELAIRLLETDTNTKIFNEDHTYALHQVLKNQRYSLLILEKEQSISNSLFRLLRQLDKHDQKLVIYPRDSRSDDEFIHLLSSLNEVDYIILQKESVKDLCHAIPPHEVYSLENNQVSFNRLDPSLPSARTTFPFVI